MVLLDIQYIHWLSISGLVALLWQLGTIFKLNALLNNEFDLTITKVIGATWSVLLIISVFRFFLNDLAEATLGLDRGWFVISVMTINLSYLYISYMLTRLYMLATTGRDPSGLELFPTYLYFLIYPIAIWKYQDTLQRTEKAHNTKLRYHGATAARK